MINWLHHSLCFNLSSNHLEWVFSYRISSTSCSYALFDMDGNQVPLDLVIKVDKIFKMILEEVSYLIVIVIWFTWYIFRKQWFKYNGRLIYTTNIRFLVLLWASTLMFDPVLMQTDNVRQEFSEDMSILRALSIVFERKPELRSLLAENWAPLLIPQSSSNV